MRFVYMLGGTMLLASSILQPRPSDARELGAHQHGHGQMNIALEGQTLWIELEAPGADIVGFEHPAESEEDKAAIESAKAKLSDPFAVLTLPDAAGCTPEDVSVEVEAVDEEHDHDHEHAEEHDDDHDHDGDHDHEGEHGDADEHGGHSAFHVEYRLTCENPTELATIGFPYFTLFPGTAELAVTVLTDRGQELHEVTAAAPSIELGN